MRYWIALLSIPALVMAIGLWVTSVDTDDGAELAPPPPVEQVQILVR
jgi:hypothetical protein